MLIQDKLNFPKLDNLVWLEQLAQPFPVSAEQIYQIAMHWQFSKKTLNFIREFPSDEVFETGQDFLDRCNELKFLIKEEHDQLPEHLRNPLD